jgi:hypothetical protein
MDIKTRVLLLHPGTLPAEADKWIAGGREYADRLTNLPAAEKVAVAQLFASYGLSKTMREKAACRAGIDRVIAPYYPKVRANNAAV